MSARKRADTSIRSSVRLGESATPSILGLGLGLGLGLRLVLVVRLGLGL